MSETKEKAKPKNTYTASMWVNVWVDVPVQATSIAEAVDIANKSDWNKILKMTVVSGDIRCFGAAESDVYEQIG